MYYSKLFTKTRKKAPKDEVAKNAKLLTQAGYINKLMAGAYSYLPLGLRVLRKIENIIREEMNNIGGQEVLLPALHPSENWRQTGGWESIDVLFKIKSRTEKEYALGQSHEEVITPLIQSYIYSYKDLPVAVYQIQNKYRDELRAKSGILRGREFGMKDMYSFHLTQEGFEKFYEAVKKAYIEVFDRCELNAKVTEASGGDFSNKISYEFMALTEVGEDEIYYCPKCDWCVNSEIAKVNAGESCPKCDGTELQKAMAVEVGNVFDLGQKYTKDFNFYVLDENGKKIYPFMGCYGIGTSRLMGTIAEKCNDEKGIIWPKSVAPFHAHLLCLNQENKEVKHRAEDVYKKLVEAGIEVLYDNRKDISPGERFADADLIGIPIRLIISEKTGDKIEWSPRESQEKKLISLDKAIKELL